MRQLIYWKCDANTSAEIIASWKQWRKLVGKANRLAKSIGAVCAYFGSSFGTLNACGFQFKEPPSKGFKRLKNTTDGYAPRAGTELEKQLSEFRCEAQTLAAKLTGIEQFSATEDGLCINSVGLKIRGKTVYLETRGKPKKGGKRVSDLEFERI